LPGKPGPTRRPKAERRNLQRGHDTAQFGKALHAADRRVARLRTAPQIIEYVLPMIRAHGNDCVLAALSLAPPLLPHDRRDEGNHVGVSGQMLGLEERTHDIPTVAFDIAQMEKMHFWPKALHHAGEVIVRTRTEGAGTERHAVGRAVDRIEDIFVVRFGRHDPRQAKQRERGIVGVAAEPQSQLFGLGHDLLEEVQEVPPQLVPADIAIFGQMRPHILKRHGFRGAGQTHGDIPAELLLVIFAHRRHAASRFIGDGICVVGAGAGTLEDMDVEGCEIIDVEAHARAAIGHGPAQIGARPIENGHEIIADHLHAAIGEITHGNLVVGDVLAPVALLLLDVLADRQALHHIPGQARWRAIFARGNLGIAPVDLFPGPHHPIGNMVQGTDDTFGTDLSDVVYAAKVLRPEPPPGLSQVRSPFLYGSLWP
jgi:hypothetical protein